MQISSFQTANGSNYLGSQWPMTTEVGRTSPVNNTSAATEGSEEKTANAAASGDLSGLSEEERRQVEELKKRDAEVRAHEQAHMAAGGPYVRGGASYQFETGPDNHSYAVGGEVSIDVSPENSPEATIRKMQVVKRAALAPRDPSGQDRSVAAQAAQTEARARAELQAEKNEETGSGPSQNSSGQNTSSQNTSRSQNSMQALNRYQQAADMTVQANSLFGQSTLINISA